MVTSRGARRVVFIDEVRGLCILLMVLFHGAYDLVYIFGVKLPIFHAPFLQAFAQPFVAGVFIFISGIATRYSRGNLKRGLAVLACGLLMTLVTWRFMPSQLIVFGILHLMGGCMTVYGLIFPGTREKPDRLPAVSGFALYGVLFACLWNLPRGYLGFPGTPLSLRLPAAPYALSWLAPLGFPGPGFFSSDYFPLLPWALLFIAGTYCGAMFRSGGMPEFFYRSRAPFLAKTGRHTLLIYLAHQPVIYGALWLFFTLLGR
jgi:uncharacterized membrane protein